MGGQTLTRADIPLPGGAEAVLTASGLEHYRHSDYLGNGRAGQVPACLRPRRPQRPRPPAAVVFCLLALGGVRLCAAGCHSPSFLFAFGGTLFSAAAGKPATPIASGFVAPHDITWAPGCAHYAFLDAGSLWVGAPGRPPVKVGIPEIARAPRIGGTEFLWRPGGNAIAVTAPASGCGSGRATGKPANPLTVLLVAVPGLRVTRLTSRCGARAINWSSGGHRLFAAVRDGPACPDAAPVCSSSDVVELTAEDGHRRTLIRSAKLNALGLDTPSAVAFDPKTGVLRAWATTSPIGGLGAFFALKLPAATILWSLESYGTTCLPSGHVISLVRKTMDYDSTGFNWVWQYEDVADGDVISKYQPQPTSGGGEEGTLSRDGRLVLWSPDAAWRDLRFATPNAPDFWAYRLPGNFVAGLVTWTPQDLVLVPGHATIGAGEMAVGLWLLDPGRKTSTRLFTAKGNARELGSRVTAYGAALSVAKWAAPSCF